MCRKKYLKSVPTFFSIQLQIMAKHTFLIREETLEPFGPVVKPKSLRNTLCLSSTCGSSIPSEFPRNVVLPIPLALREFGQKGIDLFIGHERCSCPALFIGAIGSLRFGNGLCHARKAPGSIFRREHSLILGSVILFTAL